MIQLGTIGAAVGTVLAAGLSTRNLVLGGLGLVAMAGAWLWFEFNYVPKSEYRAVRQELRQLKRVSAEKEAAAVEDAKQAVEDRMMVDALQEKIYDMQKSGDDRPVYDSGDVRWLRSFQ